MCWLAGAYVLGEVLCLSRWSVWIVLPLAAGILFAVIKMTGDRQCWLWLTLPFFLFVGFLCCRKELEREHFELNLVREESSLETDERVTVTGLVVRMTNREYGKEYLLEDVALWQEGTKEAMSIRRLSVRLSAQFMALEGDRIQVKGHLSAFEGAANPGQFDYRQYQSAKGIYLLLKGTEGQILIRGERPVCRWLADLRRYLAGCLADKGGESGGTMAALVLGDKTYLPDERYELYMDSGIGHILTLSGLHLSLFGVGLYGILRKRLSFPLWPASILMAGGICVYVALIGGGISAMRAAVALLLSLLAGCVGKTYDSLSAAALGMLLILGEYPGQITRPSFWLSFGAVFAMGGLLPLIKRWLDPMGKRKKWDQIVMPSVVIQLALMPVAALNQYTIQTYSVLLNLLVLPLMGILLGGSLCVLGTCLICPDLAIYAGYPVGLMFRIIDKLCRFSQTLPGSILPVGRPSVVRLLIYGMVLGCFGLFVYERTHLDWEAKEKAEGKSRWIGLGIVWMLLVLILTVKWNNRQLSMVFLDVGQGDCIFIETPTKTTVMVDCGSSSRTMLSSSVVEPFLQWAGVDHLDYLVLTHLDADHVNGVEGMLSCGVTVGTLIISAATTEMDEVEDIYAKIDGFVDEVVYICENDRIQCGKVEIICLYPGEKNEVGSENEASVVLQVNYKNFSCLLTGDLEGEGEEKLIGSLRKNKKQSDPGITLLKIAHHGSKYATSEQLLEIITPKAAVISCGENNRYGHPHQEVLQRLSHAGSVVYTTPEVGAVVVETDGRRWKIYGWSDRQ